MTSVCHVVGRVWWGVVGVVVLLLFVVIGWNVGGVWVLCWGVRELCNGEGFVLGVRGERIAWRFRGGVTGDMLARRF